MPNFKQFDWDGLERAVINLTHMQAKWLPPEARLDPFWVVFRVSIKRPPYKLQIMAPSPAHAEDIARHVSEEFHLKLFSIHRVKGCSNQGCKGKAEPGHRHCRTHYLEWKHARAIHDAPLKEVHQDGNQNQ